jgi:hypothetical protein
VTSASSPTTSVGVDAHCRGYDDAYRCTPKDFPMASGQGHQDPGIPVAPVQEGYSQRGTLGNPDGAAPHHWLC